METHGYRKIAGDTCYGGLDRNPKQHSCSLLHSLASKLIFVIGGILIVGMGLVYCKIPVQDIGEIAKERTKAVLQRLKELVARRGTN